ncbi:MAG: DUF4350 domain-containing protein, partial [bacterium]|nr:DUF4350 domain-containing protein [bacterium]
MFRFNLILTIFISLSVSTAAIGQQVADSTFIPESLDPAFEAGKGPVVFIDEAHNNFHTAGGRFQVFARLLRLDGYDVKPLTEKLNPENLKLCSILVISNAIADENVESWDQPNFSAFTDREVKVINDWVKEGGNLLLIADHMPMPAAAEKIAESFGVDFNNGYARPGNG